METAERHRLLGQIFWDYHIPINEADQVLRGKLDFTGHYTREKIFLKIIESYPWFTVIQLIPPVEIKKLLNQHTISKIRSKSLRQKYEFVRKRLHQLIPASE